MKWTNLIQEESTNNPQSERKMAITQYKTKTFKEIFKKNIIFILLSIFFLFGIIAGSIFIRNADISALEKLDFLFFTNFQTRISTDLTSVFIASLASSFCFIFLSFLCGLSIWGSFLIPAIPFFRGFGLGMTAGYLYAVYSWKGILYQISIILPGAILCMLAILLAGYEGIAFSSKISFRIKRRIGEISENDKKISIKVYLGRYIFITATALVAALIDVGTTACFSSFFIFE